MPIKDRSRYPRDWRDIARRIRARAGGRCEWTENGERCRARQGEPHPLTGSIVVLTTMHLDHDPANCADSNLLSACQLHHLRYDIKHHQRHAAQTRRRKKIAAGQGELL